MSMELEITVKGHLYSAECKRCGATLYTHEWAYVDHNERRDAMQAGTLACYECRVGRADPDTFQFLGKSWYAGRYSMPGYLDCTDWHYDRNLKRLERNLRDFYGDFYGESED